MEIRLGVSGRMGDGLDKTGVRIIIRSIFAPAASEGAAVPWDSPQCQQMVSEAVGEYFWKGNTHYCVYEEQPEGWDQPYRIMLKWKDSVLERRRLDGMASRVTYEAGKCSSDHYRTPYGELLMETDTHRLEIQRTAKGFLLMIEYCIRQDGQRVSENRIEIQIDML